MVPHRVPPQVEPSLSPAARSGAGQQSLAGAAVLAIPSWSAIASRDLRLSRLRRGGDPPSEYHHA